MRALRIQSTIMIVFLILQYSLGMFVNLFVSFPEGVSDVREWEFAWTQGILAAHIVLGILLLVGSIAFLIRIFKSKNETLRLPALVGILGILLAGMNGALFVNTQTEIYSYLMSLFFLVALLSYGYAVILSKE